MLRRWGRASGVQIEGEGLSPSQAVIEPTQLKVWKWPTASTASVRTWTPPFAKHQFMMGSKVSIAPVHPDFCCSRAAVPDGICWSGPIRFLALGVPRTLWALPTTV